MHDDGWQAYLERFHARSPGATERMLARSRDAGTDPYRWTADAVPDAGLVVDLACGSAPLAAHVAHGRYLGVDRSPAELGLAAGRNATVIRADVAATPLRTDSAHVVTSLLALMLAQPLSAVVAEVRRILRPDGRLVALLPATAPGGIADALRWGAVLAALGETGLPWPEPRALAPSTDWLGDGFTVVSDETRAFSYPVRRRRDAAQFVASLYLPDVPRRRRDRAVRVVQGWTGGRIGIPLRRIVARAHP